MAPTGGPHRAQQRGSASGSRSTTAAAPELVEAARRIAESGVDPREIDENVLAANLYAPELPDPDLLIRTSGEVRVSNFMLWQLAYAELVFVDRLWPDFDARDLRARSPSTRSAAGRFGGR